MATVLVVDDHATNRDLVVTLLNYKSHRALEAADGAEALALVRSERPDLVISDILMPTMDGYEFVRQLRADPALAATKVIFYTAHYHEREARKLADSCGVSHVLLKPAEPAEILQVIDQALARQPQAAPALVEKEFDREHLRLMTDKLSENVSQLLAANQRLAALTDVNLQLASERDPRALLKSVCRDARALIGAKVSVLCVRDKSDGEAMFSTTSGVGSAVAATLALPQIDAGIFGEVLTARTARRYVARGRPIAVGLPAGYPAAQSALAAPVASLTVVYGWICLLDKLGADEFDADDERILESLASQVGRIYENGSLYAELQRHTEQLKLEIAERQRSAEQLRESELRFRQLAESIREVFYLVEPSFTAMLYVSPAYEEIWGRPCESLYANPLDWSEAIHADDREPTLRTIANQGTLVGYDVEYRILRPGGETRWIRDRGFPIREPGGKVYRIAGIAEDITERVNLERAIRESEAALQLADVIAKLAHIITLPDGSIESWSATLPQVIRLDPARIPTSTRAWLDIVHPDDRERFRSIAIAAAGTGARTEIEYRLLRGDGEIIHVRQVLDPPLDSANDGSRRRWFSTLQDVSDQKRAELELRESERRFSDMLANIQLISVMLDRKARIIYCNDYMLKLTGWRREETLGRDAIEVLVPPENRGVRRVFDALLEDDPAAHHYEGEILTRSGERRLIRWDNSVLRSASGEVVGTASIGADITERTRAEEEVRRLNENLERLVAERTVELQFANRELEAFAHSVSHDLRAPLQAVQGYAEALTESPTAKLGTKDRHYLERIASASASMDRIIDDLLSLSKISKADLVATEVDLSALAVEALSEVRAADPARRSEITVRPGMRVHGDAGLLRVALTNLLANAWKFSGKRDVTVIDVGQVDDPGPTKTFFVRDRGAGFDPAYATKLFGTFQRLHTQKEFPGTGIGLATVQRVIERHGGAVRAEGAVNEGATFYFTLPR